jgi:hypothetical protein
MNLGFLRIILVFSLCLCGQSEACLDPAGEGAEVADALDLVVRKLHAEVVFETCEQFKCLEAVDPELLVKIVTGLQSSTRDFEMRGGKVQDFVGRLFNRFHDSAYFTRKESTPTTEGKLWQVWMRPRVLHELAQAFHYGRPREEIAKNVDLPA